MHGRSENHLCPGQFDELPQIHDSDTIAEITDSIQIVGDEEEGEVKFLFQPFQKVEDLGLNRHIQGGEGFIGNDKARTRSQSSRDAYPLTLSPTELVRVAIHMLTL